MDYIVVSLDAMSHESVYQTLQSLIAKKTIKSMYEPTVRTE